MTRKAAYRSEIQAADEQAVRVVTLATGFFRADEVDVACELVRERLARGADSGYEFVFVDEPGAGPPSLAGYACFGPIACTVGSYDLYWIVVDPSAQGKGLGRRLLAEVERRVRDAGGRRMYAETSSIEQYAPTRAFYERCGFRIEAELRHFYRPDDHKLIFGKAVCGVLDV